MKLKKKTAIIAGFTIGTLLFATTAFADIISKSGYDQLKDGVKITAEKASSEYDNFTLEATMAIKNNGKVLEYNSTVDKYDRIKNAQESITNSENAQGKKSTYYHYNDANTTIRSSDKEDKIYVGEYPGGRELNVFNNPFEEEEFEDVERIIDAVVGSLKDHVIVNENPDGTKELSGSLSEMQIPTLINAVSSFVLKQEFHDSRVNTGWPQLSKDIVVKDVTGSASLNQEGALENLLAHATITGKDPNGQVHEITLEVLFSLKDINSTVVTKPDLTGKEVVKEIVKDYNGVSNPQKFVGTFKNDVVIEKDGKFAKAGERFLEITQIDDKGITGRYYEVYKPEFKDLVNKSADFEFHATFIGENKRDARFETPAGDGSNVEGYIYLEDYIGKINFNLNRDYMGTDIKIDSMFNPVLD